MTTKNLSKTIDLDVSAMADDTIDNEPLSDRDPIVEIVRQCNQTLDISDRPDNPVIQEQQENPIPVADHHLFSFFNKPITDKDTTPTDNIPIAKTAIIIKEDISLMQMTNKLRSYQSQEEKNEYKKMLPYVCFAGTFEARASIKLIERSGFLVADIDHLGIEKVKVLVKAIPQKIIPVLMYISPSGDGLKVIIQTNISEGEHIEYFHALEFFFKSKFNIEIDRSGKDIARACFLCHDPDVFHSTTPTVIGKQFIEEHKNIPIAPGDYIPISVSVPEKLKVWLDKKITFTSGNRNNYIMQLAAAWNRFGIPQAEAKNFCLQFEQDDFKKAEIIRTVNSIYKNTQYHGTASFDPTKPYDFF